MTEHTAENVEKLAHDIVSDWDLDTLIEYAFTNVTNRYMNDEERFNQEWYTRYEEEFDEEFDQE